MFGVWQEQMYPTDYGQYMEPLEGLHKTMCTDWDYVNVRDFEYPNNLWKEKIQTEDDLLEACPRLWRAYTC